MKTWPEIKIIIKLGEDCEKKPKDTDCDEWSEELCEAEKRHGQTDTDCEPDDECDTGDRELNKFDN